MQEACDRQKKEFDSLQRRLIEKESELQKQITELQEKLESALAAHQQAGWCYKHRMNSISHSTPFGPSDSEWNMQHVTFALVPETWEHDQTCNVTTHHWIAMFCLCLITYRQNMLTAFSETRF